jgi:hypothetical protein
MFNVRGVKMLIPFIIVTIANLAFLIAPIDLAQDSFEYAVLTLLLFIWFDMIPLAIYKGLTYRRSFIKALKLAHIMPSEKNVKKLSKMIHRRRITFEWFFKSSGDELPLLKELYHTVVKSNHVSEETQDLLETSLRTYGFDLVLERTSEVD